MPSDKEEELETGSELHTLVSRKQQYNPGAEKHKHNTNALVLPPPSQSKPKEQAMKDTVEDLDEDINELASEQQLPKKKKRRASDPRLT